MTEKLSDADLISILRKEENTAQNWQDAKLNDLRRKALAYYDRQPFGDEEEGQSKVVTSEFADTVESVMPGLMRVFASGEEIAEFTPMEEADEQAAKEATQYVPHVMMRENDGFRIFSWFLKDALMFRLSTATVDVEEVEKTKRDPVEGWTEEQMAMAEEMAKEKGFTDVEFSVQPDPMPAMPMMAPPQVDPETGEPMPMMLPEAPQQTFSGTITYKRKKKRVALDNVAPEDLLVSPADVRDIDEASFAGYRKEVTSSTLRVMGLSQDEIDSLSADRTSSPEEDQRQDGLSQSQPRKDDQRRFWLVVAYVRVDSDGDGISEMLRVVYAHAGGRSSGSIIERMEWEEDEAPITIGSAILMPHMIIGRSLYDQTSDLQEIATVATRGLLDNLYATNRPRPMINNRVNINQVLDWTPGMPVSIDGTGNPAENISWLQTPSIIEPALTVLGYLENKRDQRTGTSRMGNNMDSDALKDASKMTLGGTQMVMSLAQERQELMARTLATAFGRMCRHVYRAIKRCAEGPTKYYAKGEWQTCDPTKWPDDMHLIVSVGTGTGNKQMELQSLVAVGQAQEKVWLAQGNGPGPAVSLEHIANTGRKVAEAGGFRATSQFFASDKDLKQAKAQEDKQQPQMSPEMIKVQGQLMAQKAKQEGELQLAAAKAQQEIMLEEKKAAAKLAIIEREGAAKLRLKEQELAINAQLKAVELRQEAALGAMEIHQNGQIQGAAQQREQQVAG